MTAGSPVPAEVAPQQPLLERLGRLRDSRAVVVLALVVLALINALWFSAFNFHTIMGDDLSAWVFYNQNPSFHDLFLTASGGKYRPVVTAVQYLLFHEFSANYQLWVTFNLALNFLIVCLVFALIRRVTRGGSVLAFFGSLLYITSRFSYYNILQLNGVMEALCILLLVLIIWVTLDFLEGQSRWPGFALAGLFVLITLTHERFIVLLPFLLLVVLFKRGIPWRLRGSLLALMCVPPLLNVILKLFVFNTEFLVGTAGQIISLDPIQVLEFMAQGVANMFWINVGPDYLSGINWSEMGNGARFIVTLVVFALLLLAVLSVIRVRRTSDRRTRLRELRGFALFLVLFLSLLLAASVTIRQEYRWLYAPFVVALVYFCYLFARLPGRVQPKYVVLAVLCVCAVGADLYYRDNQNAVFFIRSEHQADSAYDASMQRYGPEMRDRTIYVENSPEVRWIFGGTSFLAPYLGVDYQKIVWVDNIWDVSSLPGLDRDHSLVLQLDQATWSLVDVTDQVLGDARRQLDPLTNATNTSPDANVTATVTALAPPGHSGNSLTVSATGDSSSSRGSWKSCAVGPQDLSTFDADAIFSVQRRVTSETNLTHWVILFSFATSTDWAEYELYDPATASVDTWQEIDFQKGAPIATNGTVDWSAWSGAVSFFANVSGPYTGDIMVRDLRFGKSPSGK